MANNLNPKPEFTPEQAMAFVKTPAGQQLLSLLQQKGGSDVIRAQKLAAAGKTDDAKAALSSLLSDPQIQSLIKQFGG